MSAKNISSSKKILSVKNKEDILAASDFSVIRDSQDNEEIDTDYDNNYIADKNDIPDEESFTEELQAIWRCGQKRN